MEIRLAMEVSKIMKKEGSSGVFEFIKSGKSGNFDFMGDTETPRYKILTALNKYHALSFSDLKRKSKLGDFNVYYNLKRLIKDRIVIKWHFDNRYVIYSHCFIPWYEVEEIYNEKYSYRNNSSICLSRRKLKTMLQKTLKIE